MLIEKEYIVDVKLDKPLTRSYRISQETTYTLESFTYHNQIETDLLMTLDRKTESGHVFTIQLLRQWQLKKDGTEPLDLDMAQLRKKLIIETDRNGSILHVLNLSDIKKLWIEIKPSIAEKYDKDLQSKAIINSSIAFLYTDGELERILRTSYLYHGLLPGLYAENFKKESDYAIDGYRNITNAIGAIALPFKTVAKLADYDAQTGNCTIKIEGEIDQENLDKDGVAKLLRKMTDVYNLNTRLDGFHLESYIFDQDHLISESSQLTQYAIEGTLMYRTVCTILPLNN